MENGPSERAIAVPIAGSSNLRESNGPALAPPQHCRLRTKNVAKVDATQLQFLKWKPPKNMWPWLLFALYVQTYIHTAAYIRT